ncbi:Long chronological lifespan protein 2 [Hanseniaspora osmophila]|uniref:Long chronological lifespan protein 2 n=1 Tax=Hanseniaspora osmophila TaxID=56408 RepID=A0A1E5RW21_9ASCO|nr:Long chronological lifespan protein 2 [Hanseniaspora osmophila]
MKLTSVLFLTVALPTTFAFFDFGGFQQRQQQQQQQHQQQVSYEDSVLNSQCDGYLCPVTRECVKEKIDCPCEFPKSQLKCILPDKKNYICISKPATSNAKLANLYDDPVQGPQQRIKNMRDCGWVEDAYKGLV